MGVGFGGLRSGRVSRRTTIQDCIIKVGFKKGVMYTALCGVLACVGVM